MAISNNSTGLRPGVCTSTTRPTAPYEGQHIYETDTDKVLVWNGSAWVTTASTSFESYSPLYTNLTIGNGVVEALWALRGSLVFFQWQLTVGSTTSSSGTMRVGLPSDSYLPHTVFNGVVRSIASSSTMICGEVNEDSLSNFVLRSANSGAVGNLALPAAGTIISISGTYFS